MIKTGVDLRVVAFGPKVDGHVLFSEPGQYDVFAQFKHDGKVHVAPLLLEVK